MTTKQTSMMPDLMATEGYKCECCGQWVQIYHRKLNSSMAAVLLLIYKSGKRDFFHVENWLKEIGKPSLRADFHKLRFWGLIEAEKKIREDGSARNGFYRILAPAMPFCEGLTSVPSAAIIYNNELKYFSPSQIFIQTALSKKFNYEELMSE